MKTRVEEINIGQTIFVADEFWVVQSVKRGTSLDDEEDTFGVVVRLDTERSTEDTPINAFFGVSPGHEFEVISPEGLN